MSRCALTQNYLQFFSEQNLPILSDIPLARVSQDCLSISENYDSMESHQGKSLPNYSQFGEFYLLFVVLKKVIFCSKNKLRT